ncbi:MULTISPECIES: hypothetical protein [unclassified Streptomyces]|uniref:hypothetical protein n=1 Tax=unclassified Streptomyces TaxID=2593676 RepID=UPI001F3C7B81|nr:MULTISPECIES: hypothetical protein [unclassified Streptomyces]
MIVRLARDEDFPGFRGLAAQVEHSFGPMVEDAGFHDAVRKHMRRSRALVAVSSEADLLGGLLFGAKAPTYHVHWLVVSGFAGELRERLWLNHGNAPFRWRVMSLSFGFWHRSWGAVAERYRSKIALRSSSTPARP